MELPTWKGAHCLHHVNPLSVRLFNHARGAYVLEVAPCRRQQIPCLVSSTNRGLGKKGIAVDNKKIRILCNKQNNRFEHKCLKSKEKYGAEIGKSIWLRLLYHAQFFVCLGE